MSGLYGEKIIKCFNCKHDLTLGEYDIAWKECDGDEGEMKYCLCNHCKDIQREHNDYIDSFEEYE